MSLTTAQKATLKAAIQSGSALNEMYVAGNYGPLAEALNGKASPAFIVWKQSVTTAEVGDAVNYVAVAAMTDANRVRITTFYAMNPVDFDPSRSDIRTFWSDTFSGALGGQGQATRDSLEALWRRGATLLEKFLATGTGTTASPATLGYSGSIGWQEIGEL